VIGIIADAGPHAQYAYSAC